MIKYIARCPTCEQDCWWQSFPVAEAHARERALILVHCEPCKARERAEKSVAELMEV